MATPTAYTPLPLFDPVQLGTGIATLYTVPAVTVTKLATIILVNDTTSAVTATLHLVPSGGSADDTNILMKAAAIPVDGTPFVFEFNEHYLEAAGTIQAKASTADQVTVHGSGVELTFA